MAGFFVVLTLLTLAKCQESGKIGLLSSNKGRGEDDWWDGCGRGCNDDRWDREGSSKKGAVQQTEACSRAGVGLE